MVHVDHSILLPVIALVSGLIAMLSKAMRPAHKVKATRTRVTWTISVTRKTRDN
jgi:hypothetical protein